MSGSFFKKVSSNTFALIIFIAAAVIPIVYFLPPFNEDIINYDSAYQYYLTLNDPESIARLLPEDYSPPLYTIILKCLTYIFGDSLAAMRSTALIVIWGMLFLAAFPIRKAFGKRTALISALFFALTPMNFILIPEIRPTIFAYFFVTAAAVYSYLALFNDQTYAYVCFTVFSLMAMYTHNIGMLSVLFYYIAAICMLAFKKKFRQAAKFIISGIICAVCYIPWLFVVLKQFENVKTNYWSNSAFTLYDILEWSLGVNFNNFGYCIPKILFSVITVVPAILAILKLRAYKDLSELKKQVFPLLSKNAAKIIYPVLTYIGPIAMLLLFCKIAHPIIAERYFRIFSGTAMLIVAVIFGRCKNKAFSAVAAALLVVNFSVSLFNRSEQLKNSDFLEMIELIREENPDKSIAFLHSHEWSLGIMMYYFPDAKHYIYDDTWCVLNTYDVFPSPVTDIGEYENIAQYEDSFYIFGGTFPDAGEAANLLFESDDSFECVDLGVYEEPYTYQKRWLLYSVHAKN